MDHVPLSVTSDITVIDAKQSVDYLSCVIIERHVDHVLHVRV